jgi:hypothetical protein
MKLGWMQICVVETCIQIAAVSKSIKTMDTFEMSLQYLTVLMASNESAYSM